MIQKAVLKVTPTFLDNYPKIKFHYIVIIVPNTMSDKDKKIVIKNSLREVENVCQSGKVPTQITVKVVFIEGTKDMF